MRNFRENCLNRVINAFDEGFIRTSKKGVRHAIIDVPGQASVVWLQREQAFRVFHPYPGPGQTRKDCGTVDEVIAYLKTVKKPAAAATTEEIIADISHWEDPDQLLLVGSTEEGGVFVADYEYRKHGEGATFREALLDFCHKAKNDDWRQFDYGTEEQES